MKPLNGRTTNAAMSSKNPQKAHSNATNAHSCQSMLPDATQETSSASVASATTPPTSMRMMASGLGGSLGS